MNLSLRQDRLEHLDLDDPGMTPDLIGDHRRTFGQRGQAAILAAGESLDDGTGKDALAGADLADDVALFFQL